VSFSYRPLPVIKKEQINKDQRLSLIDHSKYLVKHRLLESTLACLIQPALIAEPLHLCKRVERA